MIRRKSNYFTAVGSLALAVGIGLRIWMHSNQTEFISGFLIGLSIVLLIAGLVQSRRVIHGRSQKGNIL